MGVFYPEHAYHTDSAPVQTTVWEARAWFICGLEHQAIWMVEINRQLALPLADKLMAACWRQLADVSERGRCSEVVETSSDKLRSTSTVPAG